ncbi:MAG: BON domain-containing protein [Pseudomonadota bacterium]
MRIAQGLFKPSFNLVSRRSTRALRAFACSAAALALVACASTRTSEGTGEYVDDTVITTKVKAALFEDPELKAHEINVETFKGNVQLSGFVSTKEEEQKAVEVTKNVKGVRSVKNSMLLK